MPRKPADANAHGRPYTTGEVSRRQRLRPGADTRERLAGLYEQPRPAAHLADSNRETLFLAAVSQQNVLRGLMSNGTGFQYRLPPGSCGARGVTDFAALHRLLRCAFLLSGTLSDELLRTFARQAATMPRATEAERLAIQRISQSVFRQGLPISGRSAAPDQRRPAGQPHQALGRLTNRRRAPRCL